MHVLRVDSIHSLLPDFNVSRYRLAAATDTSSRTCHDFNEVIFCLAGTYSLRYLVGVYQAVGYCHFKLCPLEESPLFSGSFNFDSSFLNTIHTSYRGNIQVLERHRLACDNFIGCT